MKKTSLKIYEVYNLQTELAGRVDQQTQTVISVGILGENLKLVTKYWLNELFTKVEEVVKRSEKLKEDLIKKHGKKDDKDGYQIAQFIDEDKEKPNPSFKKFQDQFSTLMQEDVEIEHYEFKLSQFEDVKSSNVFITLFKLIEAE